MTTPSPRVKVLILCTGNSARSQMAEALLAHKAGHRFEVASAGSRPASQVNPYAVRVLAEAGIDWSGRVPKGIEKLDQTSWDFVITVCDRAREACPIFPGQPILAHWGMPDPAEIEGEDEVKLRGFREAFTVLNRRIDLLLALPTEKLDRIRLERSMGEIGRA